MTKYYAVAHPNPQIYTDWPSCQRAVKGTKGAIYKSFTSMEDAEDFIKKHSQSFTGESLKPAETVNINDRTLKTGELDNTKPLHVYVDGSINKKHKDGRRVGAGIAYVQDNKIVRETSYGFEDETGDWQISGEISAATTAIEQALLAGFKEVTIYHDLMHIMGWATGYYAAKTETALNYVRFYNEASQHININFVKVKGHSNDLFNDRVDFLAKMGCGL